MVSAEDIKKVTGSTSSLPDVVLRMKDADYSTYRDFCDAGLEHEFWVRYYDIYPEKKP